MIKSKNCGGDIMEGVRQGKGYWYHYIDFGDCSPCPDWPHEGELWATNEDFVIIKCMGESLTFYDVINRWPIHRVTDTYQFMLSNDEIAE